MAGEKFYTIQRKAASSNQWLSLHGFTWIRKSYAEGAWSMLKAHYNQKAEHRLVISCTEEVIDTCGKQTIKPS